VRAQDSPVPKPQPQQMETAIGGSSTDPSDLFLRALERRANGERVTLSLAGKSTE